MATDLKSQLTLLKTLQDIDVVIFGIDRELETIPQKIEEATASFKEASREIAAIQAEKEKIEKKRRDGEGEIGAEDARVKEREAKLYAIKTNKEYQAAIKELADSKQAGKEREDAVFKLMEQIEGLSEKITQLSNGLADKENASKEREAELKEVEAALKADREKQVAKRLEAEGGVDKDVLKKYQFIRNKIRDAMALAVEGICTGCNKRLPPQTYIELQKWNALITCPNCRRLLFYEEPSEMVEK